MPSINVAGTLHYYELTPPVVNNQRPVLVFIHGWLLSHLYWQPLIKLLESDYQCLSYDLRGFGNSTTNNDSVDVKYDLSAYASDLCLLLEQLNIEKAWLIGHSLGGSIALWTAALSPQTVKGVICINAGGGIYLKEEFAKFRNAGKKLVKFRPFWLRYTPGLDLIFSRMMVAHPLGVYWGRQRIKDFLQANEKAALGSLLESTTEKEVHYLPHLVSRLSQPVYFIAGTQDRVMELKYVHHLASFHFLFGCGGDNVFEIAECGHFAMLEHTATVYLMMNNLLNLSSKF